MNYHWQKLQLAPRTLDQAVEIWQQPSFVFSLEIWMFENIVFLNGSWYLYMVSNLWNHTHNIIYEDEKIHHKMYYYIFLKDLMVNVSITVSNMTSQLVYCLETAATEMKVNIFEWTFSMSPPVHPHIVWSRYLTQYLLMYLKMDFIHVTPST